MAIRLWPCLVLAVGAIWNIAAFAQGGPFPPSSRPELPPPGFGPPPGGPIGAGMPGAAMPGADPLQLLLNSGQVQAELGLTPHQLQNLNEVAAHNRNKLEEVQPGRSDQTPIDLQRERETINLMIQRELNDNQRKRLDEIMLQLEGPCMAIMDRQIARKLGISPDQGPILAKACEGKHEQIRSAFKPPSRGEDPCSAMAENRARIEQIRARADHDITAMLRPEQQSELAVMMGQKIHLEPPMPPNCRF
jgi:hypothetical protein